MPTTLLSLALLLLAEAGLGAQPAARQPLPETALLDRADGRLLHLDANDVWLFELTTEVKMADGDAKRKDARAGTQYLLPAGTRFVLLPSPKLERLTVDVNERAAPRYRLWARITRYKGKNYLFPTYYLPLSKFKSGPPEAPAEEPAPAPTGPAPQAAAPNAPGLTVPPEILEQLQKQPPLPGPRKSPEAAPAVPVPPERVIADCIGRIESMQSSLPGCQPSPGLRPPASANSLTGLVFVPYALGWNVSNVRYELLPSAALEETLQKQTRAGDPVRVNVAGLIAEFKGKKYLLLQRAAVVYNYGNFSG
jgi:hypothetical protein